MARSILGMWCCEVHDALIVRGLKDAIASKSRPTEIAEGDWIRMNEVACSVIRSCLTHDIKYHVIIEVSVKKICDTLVEKYLTKSIENKLHLKWWLYHFELRIGMFMSDHLNTYTKLLADLMNVNIENDNKALILLFSSG